MKWIDYKEWRAFKKWYHKQEMIWVKDYMAHNSGILEQINANHDKITPLTLVVLEQFLNNLSKQKENEQENRRVD
jgi:hypothetical protein